MSINLKSQSTPNYVGGCIKNVPTMDYEKAYYDLLHNYQELANANEGLVKAIVKLAKL